MIAAAFLIAIGTCDPSSGQQPEDLASPTSSVDLGTIEFPAGAARGVARFYLVETRPRVDLTLWNDSSQPIYWYGAGMGCVGNHWLVEPLLPNGAAGPDGWQGISCGESSNEPVTEEFLAQTAIAPGASESWTARPFEHWFREEALDPIPPLERWAWCHEFTVPRATPPQRTTDFEEHGLMLSWSRSGGPRAFLGHPSRVHSGAFDPIGEMPSSASAVPFRIGPLTGEAWLTGEGRALRVEWRLRNPSSHAIRWDWESNPGAPPVEEIPPGKYVSGAWSPFLDAKEADPRAEAHPSEPNPKRWHCVLASTWPVIAEEASDRPPRAWLHAAWQPDVGLSVWLSRSREESTPFSGEAGLAASAALRLGAGWVLVRCARGSPSSLDVLVAPAGERAYWHDRDTMSSGDFRWTTVDRRVLQPWLPPSSSEAHPPGRVDPRWWTIREPTPLDGPPAGSHLKWAWPVAGEDAARKPALPWECVRWVMVPRASLPAHDRDFELALLRLSWDPDRGINLEIGERRAR
jgi:hypothetical protein